MALSPYHPPEPRLPLDKVRVEAQMLRGERLYPEEEWQSAQLTGHRVQELQPELSCTETE